MQVKSICVTLMKAHLVPASEDQAPMIEQTRELVRLFNMLYKPLLVEPELLVSNFPDLPGIDGKAKMSKTAGNAIYLADDPEPVTRKVMQMYTDSTRLHPTDPWYVEGNPSFIYDDAFNPNREGGGGAATSLCQGSGGRCRGKTGACERAQHIPPMRSWNPSWRSRRSICSVAAMSHCRSRRSRRWLASKSS